MMLIICFRLKPAEIRFLREYVDVVQPFAKALDILQAEKKAYMGYLVPTLCMLQEKLRDKRDLANSCRPLVEALLAGISRRFSVILDDAELIASAILHPKFKRDWTDDASILEKGI